MSLDCSSGDGNWERVKRAGQGWEQRWDEGFFTEWNGPNTGSTCRYTSIESGKVGIVQYISIEVGYHPTDGERGWDIISRQIKVLSCGFPSSPAIGSIAKNF
jgi:hypothetical protein